MSLAVSPSKTHLVRWRRCIFASPSGVPHRADMLYVHPFCHEIYNSRAISMAMCFRQLAAAGVGVLAVDLPGCGDSQGVQLEDARWDVWKNSTLSIAYTGFERTADGR